MKKRIFAWNIENIIRNVTRTSTFPWGKKMAIILRQKALDDYYKDPNICKECGRIIEVGDRKVREIRKRSFVIKVVELSIIIGLNREAQNRLPKEG